MISIHPFGSHLAPLMGCVASTHGRVLELGSGVFSTPALHTACRERELVTADNDPEWMQRFLYLQGDSHRFELVSDWSSYAALDEEWGVALVDQSPGYARAPSIERLRERTRLIIVHDTNEVAHYKFEPLLSSFAYRQDFLELGTPVRTTVVSDHGPLPFSIPPVTANHTSVVLSETPIRIQTSDGRWRGHTVSWPEGTGHFFLAGEMTIETPPDDLIVHALYIDDEGRELFWMALVPGALRGDAGSFCVAQEMAAPVPSMVGGHHKPTWSAVRRLMVRAKARNAAVSIANLRLLALPALHAPAH